MASSREKTPSFSRSASLEILPRSALNRILAQTRSSRHIHLCSMKTHFSQALYTLRLRSSKTVLYACAARAKKARTSFQTSVRTFGLPEWHWFVMEAKTVLPKQKESTDSFWEVCERPEVSGNSFVCSVFCPTTEHSLKLTRWWY